ncbi:ABC transporter permease/M1 family aminopeptidase [Hymenobacter wooponensis]|uniref:ABC transporter permease n=1 Tax=Hymenobacter wooponensis TaxID=1525360 RepID=A0A4Z0MLW5_9BACT|nr:M1 family aminopeptidase [Hymenobacter wooponensis]TGD80743.1 ABC transporter permease [Hymenobacter wooponensis]
MKLQTIFAFEFRYQLRRATTWLYFGALLVLAFLIVTANYASDARDGYFLVNAPVVIASVAVICSGFWLVIGASVAGEAAARDVQTRMHLLTYPAPASKAAYLGGRFLAALALNSLLVLAVPLGILLAMYGSGIEADLLGPLRPAAYLTTLGFILLPNALFATATQFSVATLSRRAMGSYLGATTLWATAYLLGFALQHAGEWRYVVDPMGFNSVMDYLTKWGPLERNVRLVLPEGSLLANRLLWLVASLGLLAFTYFRFRFVLPETGSKPKPAQQPTTDKAALEQPQWGTGNARPLVKEPYGVATQLRQLRLITGDTFWQLAKSKYGLPLLAVLAGLAALTLRGNLKARGVPLLPRTDFVLHLLTAPLTEPKFCTILITLLTIFYAGELVWRERETGLSDITNAAPVPEWVLFGGRFLALAMMSGVWLVLLMAAGGVAQVALGGTTPEIGLYLQTFFGLQLVECVLFALLALLVHVLVNQKFVGHLVTLAVYGFMVFAHLLGIEHKLLVYSASPHWTYTDMAGFGPTLAPWLWFKGYWLAWALLLAVAGVLFWVRGREISVASRLQLARRRFTGSLIRVAAVITVAIVGLGGFIFYNTNVLHDYSNASASAAQRAVYEQRYRRYQNVPQPQLTGVNLRVELYPKQQTAEIQGTYLLVNNTPVAIDSVHVATGTDDVETTAVAFDQPARPVLTDVELGHYIYALNKPLLPGDSLRLRFRVTHQAHGFSNRGADAQVLANGTSFRNLEWLPVIGYQPYRELDETGARKAHGLAPRPATYSLYDVAARRYAPFPEQIRFEAVVGTDAGQTVVAPGTLRRTWTTLGRRYFHYASDAPIRNEYAFFSANYAVQEGKWRNPSAGAAQEVAIQIYYPPSMTENPARMIRSAQASLDYYTRQFGPYPHRQLRFVAQPGHSFGNHAAPINITAGEGFFLLNTKADKRDFDLVTAVVAHEVAHQWWGNQLKQAYVEGAGLISESLAWYSAMGVLEDNYGADHLPALLSFLREENETPRTRAAKPLLQADDFYQNYRKGPFALYALSQHIGRDRVNGALRQLLAKHRPGTRPFATSLDLYQELQTATPDSLQPLLHDLFRANTFWELATTNATAKQLKGGAWQVTLGLQAHKLVVDSAGTETKLPMQEWVEVGVFAPAKAGQKTGRPLYLQKHLITSGQQTIVLTVPSKPAKAGLDPRGLLIDWEATDNSKAVTAMP